MTAKESRQYHPLFNSPDADVVLISAEHTSYRVPSSTLRNTCNLFRDLPSSSSYFQVIEVDEPDSVLTKVLCFICGRWQPTDHWESIDQLEATLEFIQKWDAFGPLSLIRSSVPVPWFPADPLRLYAIATRFGWGEEAQLASTHTLSLNLYDNEHRPKLERLSSVHLMALLRLHRFRRNEFKRMLDNEPAFDIGNTMEPAQCTNPGCTQEISHHTWRELKVRMFMEMDKRPLGDTLVGFGMEEWPEAIACWNAKCQRPAGCNKMNYNKVETLRSIKDCIDRLPVHI